MLWVCEPPTEPSLVTQRWRQATEGQSRYCFRSKGFTNKPFCFTNTRWNRAGNAGAGRSQVSIEMRPAKQARAFVQMCRRRYNLRQGVWCCVYVCFDYPHDRFWVER